MVPPPHFLQSAQSPPLSEVSSAFPVFYNLLWYLAIRNSKISGLKNPLSSKGRQLGKIIGWYSVNISLNASYVI